MSMFMPPFLLIRWDGTVDEFNDLAELACAIRRQIIISDYHVSHATWYEYHTKTYYNEWIVRDSLGQVVREADIYASAPFRTSWRQKELSKAQYAAKLGLPIPKTGRRHLYKHYLRRIRTQRANRAYYAARVDDRDGIRPKGRLQNLPTYWDDFRKASSDDRCWKRFRHRQARDRG